MDLLNGIIANFSEWQCQILEDGTKMHSRQFSGEVHAKLKSNFKSSYSLLSQENRTIAVCCFVTYSNVAILSHN